MNVKFLNIPDELRSLPQWVSWREARGNGDDRPRKPPLTPDGRNASTTRYITWSAFAEVAPLGRVGFVFTERDDYVGIDLDDCINERGELSAEAVGLMRRFDSYTEKSPSGTGIHIILKGKLDCKGISTKELEVYDRGRYFTFTGDVVNPKPIESRQEELTILLRKYKQPEQQGLL